MKLLIPGPVNVEDKYLDAMTMPMIGHRSKDFEKLHKKIISLLKELLHTGNDIFLITSSASGAMEAAIRNTVHKNVLCIANGDFGRRWHEIAKSNGKSSTLIDFGDAKPYDFQEIASELRMNNYDAVAMVINETTAGIENDVEELKSLLEGYPGTLLLADAVTAAFGTYIDLEGIDVLLFGTQKALALPPGIAITVVSKEALARAGQVEYRGYYFDYMLMKKNADKNLTVNTPNIQLMHALLRKLEDIKETGMDGYIMMHKNLSTLARERLRTLGLKMLVDDEHASNTVTVVISDGLDVKNLQESMRAEGFDLANGYGALKDITFRIGHMGLDRQTTLEAIEKIGEKALEQREKQHSNREP